MNKEAYEALVQRRLNAGLKLRALQGDLSVLRENPNKFGQRQVKNEYKRLTKAIAATEVALSMLKMELNSSYGRVSGLQVAISGDSCTNGSLYKHAIARPLTSEEIAEITREIAADQKQAAHQSTRDREQDRARYPDPDFNRWLDESITENGEYTAWHALSNTGDAYAGWSVRPNYAAQPAPAVPAEVSEKMIDLALSARIPGGSAASHWFLPHDTEKGRENVRDVVRRMLAEALLSAAPKPEQFKPNFIVTGSTAVANALSDLLGSNVVQCPPCEDFDPDAVCPHCSIIPREDVAEWSLAVRVATPVPHTGMVTVKARTILAINSALANAIAVQGKTNE